MTPFRLSALLLAGLLAMTAACSNNDDGPPSAPTGQPGASATPPLSVTPTAPEDALAIYVQRRLSQGFVPDCADAERPADVGKQCASKLGERDGLVAYALGPTFGEYTRIMVLAQQDGGWTIALQEVRDPNAPDVPGIPWPLSVGAEVIVAGTAPDCLKIREQPSVTGAELNCLADGTELRVVAGPVDADDVQWWQLEGHGWAAGNYLRYPDAAVPEETPEETSD